MKTDRLIKVRGPHHPKARAQSQTNFTRAFTNVPGIFLTLTLLILSGKSTYVSEDRESLACQTDDLP